jgi:hypothetical protein
MRLTEYRRPNTMWRRHPEFCFGGSYCVALEFRHCAKHLHVAFSPTALFMPRPPTAFVSILTH